MLNRSIIKVFANQLVQLHKHAPTGNSVLSEALLLAYLEFNDSAYEKTARDSFELSLSIESITPMQHAEKIMALSLFYEVFKEEHYFDKMQKEFNWFLGENRLHHIVYNPKTAGCFDGLEETHINLNQGAESSIGYFMARLTIEKQLLERQRVSLMTKEAQVNEKVSQNSKSLIIYSGIRSKSFLS